MAHVAAWKKELLNELVKEMVDNRVVAIVDMHGIAGQQIQSMRAGLRQHAIIKMTKNNLMLLALDEASKQKPGLDKMKSDVHGQCALVMSDYNAFKLAKQLSATMTAAPAKAGQLAPIDIVVPQGPTPFGPGPIIGELQKIGLPAAIDSGKIVIRKDTTLVKAGQPVPAGVATMLPKLNILPMIVGLDLRSAFEDGTIYSKSVLDIPDNYYHDMFATAAANARALGVSIAFPAKETIKPLLAKAYREAMGLSVSAAIPTKDNIKVLLSKADAQMLSLASAAKYADEGIAARLNAAAAAAPAATKSAEPDDKKGKKDTEKKDEPVSEADAAAGLSALFG
jgi:large subunit ribosomal protein L10